MIAFPCFKCLKANGHSLYQQNGPMEHFVFSSSPTLDVLFRQHTSPFSWLQETSPWWCDPKAVARAHLLYDPEQSLKVVGGKWIGVVGWWKKPRFSAIFWVSLIGGNWFFCALASFIPVGFLLIPTSSTSAFVSVGFCWWFYTSSPNSKSAPRQINNTSPG